jgi:tetratricopeptide (TPR) repeat protein
MARAAILAVLVTAAAPARADEPIPTKARALAETGRSAHDRGDYGRAIAAFKEAYVMAPSPALLFNLAQAYRLQGNCDDASLMYRRYLASGASDESSRAIAQSHLATVERCMHKRSLNIPMDESMSYLQVKNPPADLGIVDASPSDERPRSLTRDVGLGLTIGGGAALAVAAYYGWQAHAAASDVERGYAMGVKFKDLASRQAEGEHAASTARLFGIGGGAALATGITMFVIGRRTGVPIAITPTGHGAQVSLAWRL